MVSSLHKWYAFPMSKPKTEKELVRQYVENWKIVNEEMDRMKTEELRALTEEQAARCFDGLAWPRESLWFSPERLNSDGMIEQQRLFQRGGKKH